MIIITYLRFNFPHGRAYGEASARLLILFSVIMTSKRAVSSGPLYGLNPALQVRTPEPPVPKAKAWAQAYPSRMSPFRSTSLPLLNLAQGVPGHEPHSTLLTQMESKARINPMETHGYGGVFGDLTLRKALADDINHVYCDGQPVVEPANVAITSGCNLAAAVTFHALAEPGDAIVLPVPWYFNHQMTLVSLGIDVVPLDTPSPGFLPSPEAFEALLQQRNAPRAFQHPIRGIVLVSPNNPTGAQYPDELLSRFVDVCRRWGVACILDETYRDFLLDGTRLHDTVASLSRPHSLYTQRDDWQDHIISLHSFSKSYAIPGHRLGAILTHPSLLITPGNNGMDTFGPLAKSLDNLQICPPRTDTQRAVAACVRDEEHRSWRLKVANDLQGRRATFVSTLQAPLTLHDALEQVGLKATSDTSALFGADISSLHTQISPASLGWACLSSGGYYAYVRHPFDAPSEVVARGLALLCGVVVLPGKKESVV